MSVQNGISTIIINKDKIDRGLLLNAYNDYQENQHCGVDYIFNFANKEDLISCIKGGLNISELHTLYDNYLNNEDCTTYFFFGENYIEPKQIKSKAELDNILFNSFEDVLLDVLTYPNAYDSYKKLYAELIIYGQFKINTILQCN